MPFKIATFNVENLFSRPKLLNFDKNAEATPLLNKVARLSELIDKESYLADDRRRILELATELKPYVEITEVRKKLFGRRKVDGKFANMVVATGRGDWIGGLEFKRESFSFAAQVSTAEVIKAVSADVFCLVEVENRSFLEEFARAHLKPAGFSYDMVIDGNDSRGIDLGLLSRFIVSDLRSHIHDRDPARPSSRIFSRDCLEACVELPGSKPLWVLLNHFKSKGYGPPAQSDARRKLQAQAVAQILERFDLANDLVCVMGDLNDTPAGKPLAPLLQSGLVDVLERQFPNPSDRWTYSKPKSQIDYLLCSPALMERFTQAGIERRGLYDAARLTNNAVAPFPSAAKSPLSSASDHCAVWAEFA